MEPGFVRLDEKVRRMRWAMRYCGCSNITGRPLDGYYADVPVGTEVLADALVKAAKAVRENGLGLFVWDAYRPKKAVARFMAWTMEDGDFTRDLHYPGLRKADLVRLGYIQRRSAHCRGSAVDLTLYDFKTGRLVPMGTDFDFMGPESAHGCLTLPDAAVRNRMMLRGVMESCGFEAFEKEWWHYSLLKEPFPDTEFDFDITEAAG